MVFNALQNGGFLNVYSASAVDGSNLTALTSGGGEATGLAP